MLKNWKVQLTLLTLGHLLVDMYGGILAPVITRLATNLKPDGSQAETAAVVADLIIMVAVCSILVNAIQPIAGVISHRFNSMVFLFIAPVIAALCALIGFAPSLAVLYVIVIFSRVGIGIYHPVGLVSAHSVSGDKEHVAIPVFMSGGFFGFSLGAIISTQWVSRIGFSGYWLLAMPALPLAILLFLSHPPYHQETGNSRDHEKHRLSFWPVLALGACIAIPVHTFFSIYNIHMDQYFGMKGLKAGGVVLAVIGMGGAITSWFWGYLSKRISVFHLIAVTQLISLPLYLGMIEASSELTAILLSLPASLVMGGATFPVLTTLSQRTRGHSRGLKAGLMVGGSWGTASVFTILCGVLIRQGITVREILAGCSMMMPVSALIALAIARMVAAEKTDRTQ